MKYPYRADKECLSELIRNLPIPSVCTPCLMGQQADEMSLMNSAIANLTASLEESKMEAIHKEE